MKMQNKITNEIIELPFSGRKFINGIQKNYTIRIDPSGKIIERVESLIGGSQRWIETDVTNTFAGVMIYKHKTSIGIDYFRHYGEKWEYLEYTRAPEYWRWSPGAFTYNDLINAILPQCVHVDGDLYVCTKAVQGALGQIPGQVVEVEVTDDENFVTIDQVLTLDVATFEQNFKKI